MKLTDLDVDQELGGLLTNQFGDRYYYGINRATFNHTGAEAVYRSHLGDSLFKENTFYLIAGCDSGILIHYLIKHGVPDGSRYLFVELPQVAARLDEVLNGISLAEHPRIDVCTPDQWLVRAQKASMREYAFMDAIHFSRSMAVIDAHMPAYRMLWRGLDLELRQHTWQLQAQFGNCTFIQRQIENLPDNRVPARVLRGLFPGQTAVLLGGGPSLDDILPWVQAQREHLVIIAVSRIAKRLLAADLQPHILVTVDPHLVSFEVSREMLQLDAEVLLVNAHHASPMLTGQWHGPSVFLNRRFSWDCKYDELENIHGASPTVANSALNLAMEMGFGQVVLAGIDLCFDRQGYSHASGSIERVAGPLVSLAGQTVRTNSGRIAETENSLFNATQAFAAQARQAHEQYECRIINPAPDAAVIEGVEHIPLTEIELPSAALDAWDRIAAALPGDDRAARLQHYQSCSKELKTTRARLRKVQELARTALEYNDGLFGRKGKTRDFKYKIKMDRIEKRINKEFKEYADLAKVFGMRSFVKVIRPDRDTDWTDEEIESSGRAFYEAYLEGAATVIKVLDQGLERLRCRALEEEPAPDFEALVKQWRADQQPRRASLWRRRHGTAALDAEVRVQLEQLEDDYQALLTNEDTQQLRDEKAKADLRGTECKAMECFINHDLDGLTRLAQALENHPKAAAKPLHHLVIAYIAELENRVDDAIQAYEGADQGPARENALRRLAGIALDQDEFNYAIIAMDLLCQLSPSYMPQYAELLRITGRVQDALDIYTQYLSVAPDDLASMMKLGMLYHRLGVREGAEWVFRHITERDPDNEAARTILNDLRAQA